MIGVDGQEEAVEALQLSRVDTEGEVAPRKERVLKRIEFLEGDAAHVRIEYIGFDDGTVLGEFHRDHERGEKDAVDVGRADDGL